MRAFVVFLGASLIAGAAQAAIPAPTSPLAVAKPAVDPGRVTLKCTIKEDGGLEKCVVSAEGSDQSVADAALQMVSQFRVDPKDGEGKSRAGDVLTIPVQINIRNN